MTAPIFVDTNVFVYSRDLTEPDKQESAQAWLEVLWDQRLGRISFQVLNEYYVTVTKKLDHPMPVELARQDVQDLLAWNPTDVNDDLLVDAWSVEERFGFSWWDALIVGSARAAGSAYLLSEDLQHGQRIDDLEIINPFITDLTTVVR